MLGCCGRLAFCSQRLLNSSQAFNKQQQRSTAVCSMTQQLTFYFGFYAASYLVCYFVYFVACRLPPLMWRAASSCHIVYDKNAISRFYCWSVLNLFLPHFVRNLELHQLSTQRVCPGRSLTKLKKVVLLCILIAAYFSYILFHFILINSVNCCNSTLVLCQKK